MDLGYTVPYFQINPCVWVKSQPRAKEDLRYLWKKRRGSIKISVLVHQKLRLLNQPPFFGLFLVFFTTCSRGVLSALSRGIPWALCDSYSRCETVPWDHPWVTGLVLPKICLRKHIVCLSGWSKQLIIFILFSSCSTDFWSDTYCIPDLQEKNCTWTILNHLEPSWTILNHLEPSWTILNPPLFSHSMVTWWRFPADIPNKPLQPCRRVKAMTPTPWGRRPKISGIGWLPWVRKNWGNYLGCRIGFINVKIEDYTSKTGHLMGF